MSRREIKGKREDSLSAQAERGCSQSVTNLGLPFSPKTGNLCLNKKEKKIDAGL
jgi:hypothetical protein